MVPGSTDSSRTTARVKKRYKNLDLKSFYSSSSSNGRGSSRNTNESVTQGQTEGQGVPSEAEVQRSQSENATEAQAEFVAAATDAVEIAQVDDTQNSELINNFVPDIHIVSDPALRIPIDRFHPNIRGDVRRAYLLKGPTKPFGHNFPRTHDNRSFSESWLKKNDWLEYSVEKDAAFCFYCFLFKQEPLDEKFGHDAFTKVGFRTWKNAYHAFPLHVGGPISCHNRARTACDDFKNERASVPHKVTTHDKDAEARYEIRLTTSLCIARFLISQGLAFRGHNETSSSLNRGNFLELLEWFKQRNPEAKAAFEELCPLTAQMTSHKIQKDLTEACAIELRKVMYMDSIR
ncbi:hypothetical protein EJB05_29054, partial [Eragrostis curvula]